jgi:L-threonylcarbamoyladenylate synthase
MLDLCPTSANCREAAALLREGHLVAFPTETVYGLGADAANADAVQRIYALKGRPAHNPLIVHVAQREQAQEYAQFSPLALLLAETFWPGALTLVLPKKPNAPLACAATAGLDTVAIRIPNHPVALALLMAFGGGVVAPSANRSNRLSPTTATHVRSYFGNALRVLDGGACSIGVESTIVQITPEEGWRVLRPGGVSLETLQQTLTIAPSPTVGSTILAPGQMAHHYAPCVPLRLNVTQPMANEAYLSFGKAPPLDVPVFPLSDEQSLEEAAQRLFSALFAAERSGQAGIAVAPIPEKGIGVALNDRLRRASTTR